MINRLGKHILQNGICFICGLWMSSSIGKCVENIYLYQTQTHKVHPMNKVLKINH